MIASDRPRPARLAPLALLLLLACGESPAAPVGCDPAPRNVVCLNGHALTVEVADEPDERSTGLMRRDSLPEDRGMLFVFPGPDTLRFWMRETTIPLDLAYLDAAGTIFQIEAMEPLSLEVVESDRPARFALEVNRGWFAAHGVAVGDTARLGGYPAPAGRQGASSSSPSSTSK